MAAEGACGNTHTWGLILISPGQVKFRYSALSGQGPGLRMQPVL